MADCYKALLTSESSCVSASVAIIHLLTQGMSLRILMHLRKNITTVAMLTRDALLCHFRKEIYHSGNKWLCTLISYVLLVSLVMHPVVYI